MINSFVVKNGLFLKPTTLSPSVQGDIVSDTTSGNLKYFNGTVNNAIATETNTLTLTHKTINAPDNVITNISNAEIATNAAILDTKLDTIKTAGKVLNSATTATSANTPNAIITRDSSGNFSAGTITANITGNTSGTSSTFTGSLNGDVTSVGMTTTVALVGGSSASDVHSATLLALAATNANTASAIVKRDSNGDFTARDINARTFIGALAASNLTGTVALANGGSGQDNTNIVFPASGTLTTNAGTQTLTNKTIATASNSITGTLGKASQFNASTGALEASSVLNTELAQLTGVSSPIQTQLNTHTTNITTNTSAISAHTGASTGVHGVTGSVVGTTDTQTLTNKTLAVGTNNITGNAAKAAQFNATTGNLEPSTVSTTQLGYLSGVTSAIQTQLDGKLTALTGDVTSSGFTSGSVTATITNNAVTNAKAAQMTANTLKGNNTGSTTNPLDLSTAQVTAMLNAFTSDNGVQPGLKGLVPAPSAGDAAAGKMLRADGTWSPAGTASPLTTKGDLYGYSTTNARLAVGSDGQVLVADSTATTGLRWDSASKGSKNYVTYPDFENGLTTGWSLGTATLTNNLPSGTPTFGSGASSNLSISTVSSGQLSGTRSLSLVSSAATTAGNFLASSALSIDSSDQAKVLSFKFNYKVSSGTINASGTSSNSFGVAIYDVTNSQWIIPTGAFNIVQTTGVGTAQGTFQTPSNMVSFRIVVYNANATSAAVTMLFDDFYVGPQSLAFGPAVTDWTNFTHVIEATSVNPTKATTPDYSYARWRRVGDSMEIMMGYAHSNNTGSATGTGTYLFKLPSGYVIDSTKTQITGNSNQNNVGVASGYSNGDLKGHGWVYPYDSTHLAMVLGDETVAPNDVSSSWYAITNTVIVYNFIATVPIAGWSSNTVMSNDSDTRTVAAYINGSSIANGASINFGAATLDTHAAWNGTTTYTVPVSGVYKVSAQMQFTVTATAGQYFNLSLYKNNNPYANQTKRATGGSTVTDSFSLAPVLVKCNAGDTLTLGCPGTNYSSVTASADASWLLIERLSGNAVVAASETVAAKYSTDVGQTMTNNAFTRVNFYSKDFDSHNAVTTGVGVWIFKAPVSGRYLVSGTATITGATVGSTNILGGIYKNDVIYARGPQAGISTGTTGAMATTIVPCLAGETISFWLFQANGADRYLEASLICNHIEIVKIGNL